MNVNKLMAELERRHPGESEYLQAVREVLMTVEETYNQHPEFERPTHRGNASWSPTARSPSRWSGGRPGRVQVNTGYRVQFNNAIGPYKAVCVSTPR